MSKLREIFTDHKAFIPFIVADDPNFATTVANVLALADGGADIVELGIPFSDSSADGPVIQDADLRAFAASVTPTSAHRVQKIAEAATGFIYVVSALGITGQWDEFAHNLTNLVAQIRQYTDVPTAIGFGIHDKWGKETHDFNHGRNCPDPSFFDIIYLADKNKCVAKEVLMWN